MRTKLQQMPSFNDINAPQDSISLIKSIKGLTLKFDVKQYAPMAMVNVDTRLYTFSQGQQTTDALYYEPFKSLIEDIEHYQGKVGHHPKLILQEVELLAKDRFDPKTPLSSIASMEPSIINPATELARQKYLACLFLNGVDKTRYGSLVDGVMNDYVKGLDTFPKSLQDAFVLLTETTPLKDFPLLKDTKVVEEMFQHVGDVRRREWSLVNAPSRHAWRNGRTSRRGGPQTRSNRACNCHRPTGIQLMTLTFLSSTVSP